MGTSVLIVCDRRYNGHQLDVALRTLAERGHSFELISTHRVIENEVTHKRNKVTRIVGEINLDEIGGWFGAFMMISGYPKDTEAYWHNETVHSYVDAFNDANLPIAAICGSVPTIRGAAKGKKVSFFPLIRSRELLRQAGAILQNVALTVDQNLVTAEHEMASQMWAEEFCNLLEGRPQQYFFEVSTFTPQGAERKPIPIVEDIRRKLANGKANNAVEDSSQCGDSTPAVS